MPKIEVILDAKEVTQALLAYVISKTGIPVSEVRIRRLSGSEDFEAVFTQANQTNQETE